MLPVFTAGNSERWRHLRCSTIGGYCPLSGKVTQPVHHCWSIMGTETEFVNTVKRRKLQYFGHMTRVQNTYTYFEGRLNCKKAGIS